MLTHHRATPRRLLIAATGLALVAASLSAVASPATAATTTNVTVTGTSDVYDSGLIQGVIGPGFQKAYPQYKLNYISEGTGKAITDAENGVADALIVHAPSLENAFVAGTPITAGATPPGVSYSNEPAGRAIFWGDYILAGATGDPAGVDAADPATAAPHDIVKAFEDVATAGAAGNANFVSRGGTPGTTVQEHAIWALTTGVPTCTITGTGLGGGAVPSTTANADGTCPSAGPTYPSWYHITGLTQGPNIVNANTCNYGANSANSNNCYVFTDRGTFNYLQSGSTVQAGNLSLLVRDNDVPGQTTLLVNTFHAYVVNPAAVPGGQNLNTAGATAFLNYLTSPVGQAAIGQYLNGSNDPPFIPDAQPSVVVGGRPTLVNGGTPVTITGTVSNVVPGTPALSGVAVNVLGQPTSTPNADYTPVASGTTKGDGSFSIKFTPKVNSNYEVTTPALPNQFEYHETPGPDFSDALQATTTTLGAINVKGVFTSENPTTSAGQLKVTGTVNPVRTGNNAYLALYARPADSTGAYAYHGRHQFTGSTHGFNATYALPAGNWSFYLKYNNTGVINSGVSPTQTVTVS